MRSSRVALVVTALLVGGIAAGGGLAADGVTGGVAGEAPGAATTTTTTTAPAGNASDTSTVSFGQQLSSFMQSNAAHTDESVETGMWVAAYRSAPSNASRAALVRGRVDELNVTIAELRAEKRALRRAYENGTIDRATYRARLGRIVGRLSALGEAIETVEPRARDVGVNTTRLRQLRANAGEVAGGEIAEIARGLAGRNRTVGPPWLADDNRTGPPPGAGPPGDDGDGDVDGDEDTEGAEGDPGRSGSGERGDRGTDAAGNESRGGSDTGTGQSGDDGADEDTETAGDYSVRSPPVSGRSTPSR